MRLTASPLDDDDGNVRYDAADEHDDDGNVQYDADSFFGQKCIVRTQCAKEYNFLRSVLPSSSPLVHDREFEGSHNGT